ncbi:MAG TPA: hypothetical protein VK599_08030 [Streptosporangiaceae bacterium]|nr:hypothetical protein [Streptosporangiaceae bacterium]
MTDSGRVNSLLQAVFSATATGGSLTPGTGGGSGFAVSPPYHLRLMTTAGSNTSNGTEATGVNCPGYTALGSTLGTQFCAAPVAAVQSNANAVTWNATGTWTTVPGIEVWDTAATPLRWLQGTVTSPISGVVNGDSVIFAAGAISANAQSW